MIVITGIPRSGTTLTAKLFQSHGANLGENVCPRTLEHLGFRRNVVKPILQHAGYDPKCQSPLPDNPLYFEDDGSLKQKIQQELQGVDVLKCPKSMWIWITIQDLFPEWDWIVVTRDLEEIMQSAVSSRMIANINNFEDAKIWVAKHYDVLKDLLEQQNEYHVWNDPEVLWDMLEDFGYTPQEDIFRNVMNQRWG